MGDDPRKSLADAQRRLVEALTRDNASAADGFDAAQIHTAAAALADKRMHSARKAWPALADALGERFGPLFRDYAARHPLPTAGPSADAAKFLAYLAARRDLTDQERLTLLPLRAQRGWPVRCVIARRCGRGAIAFAVRLPGRPVRTFSLSRYAGRD